MLQQASAPGGHASVGAQPTEHQPGVPSTGRKCRPSSVYMGRLLS
ncbi:hypothetical protein [Kitasatospora sp. NPDC088134]